jgi:hypothetical protein
MCVSPTFLGILVSLFGIPHLMYLAADMSSPLTVTLTASRCSMLKELDVFLIEAYCTL